MSDHQNQGLCQRQIQIIIDRLILAHSKYDIDTQATFDVLNDMFCVTEEEFQQLMIRLKRRVLERTKRRKTVNFKPLPLPPRDLH